MIFDTIYGKKGVNQPLLLMVRNATWKGLVVVVEDWHKTKWGRVGRHHVENRSKSKMPIIWQTLVMPLRHRFALFRMHFLLSLTNTVVLRCHSLEIENEG